MAKSHNQQDSNRGNEQRGHNADSNQQAGQQERQQSVPHSVSHSEPSFRGFFEIFDGRPALAGALGAIVGGTVASMLATEQGRTMLKSGFNYARPMITNFAREIVDGRLSGKSEASRGTHH